MRRRRRADRGRLEARRRTTRAAARSCGAVGRPRCRQASASVVGTDALAVGREPEVIVLEDEEGAGATCASAADARGALRAVPQRHVAQGGTDACPILPRRCRRAGRARRPACRRAARASPIAKRRFARMYRGTLADGGAEVAVKVQRPSARRQICSTPPPSTRCAPSPSAPARRDIDLLKILDLVFSEVVRELDFNNEATNAAAFERSLAHLGYAGAAGGAGPCHRQVDRHRMGVRPPPRPTRQGRGAARDVGRGGDRRPRLRASSTPTLTRATSCSLTTAASFSSTLG